MEVKIYDTWVKGKKGTIHFDVALEEKTGNDKLAVESAKKYLESIGEKDAKITGTECNFCHTQGASAKIEKDIKKNGFGIIRM